MNSLIECRRYAGLMAFNRFPSRYLHPDRRAGYFGLQDVENLFKDDHAHGFLSSFILQKETLEDITDEQSVHLAVRMGIEANCAQLSALASRIGLILIGGPIRRAIDPAAVTAWTGALGDRDHEFVCRQASLFGGTQFTRIAQDPFSTAAFIPSTSASHLLESGLRFINICCELLTPAVGKRFQLKLQQSTTPSATVDISPGFTEEAWIWIDRIWRSMPTPIFPLTTQSPAT
jgi:hypothetical protein